MAPGTWAQLTVSNQNAVLGVGNVSGSTIGYCSTMPWNPHSKVIEIIGSDHNGGSPRHARYEVATNSFVLVDANTGLSSFHGYDHQTVNPHTGDLYSRLTADTGPVRVRKKVFNGSSFVGIPDGPSFVSIANGVTWWSGSFSGAGAQGALMAYITGDTNGRVVAYNPLTNAWFFSQTMGGGGTYHTAMEYSAVKNVAVFGGGNGQTRKVWRLNSNGTFTVMPDLPSGLAWGVNTNGGILVDDPVTGNFLLLSAGQLWELNPSGSGTWTQQTGARTPPGGVGVPGSEFVIASSNSDYGVVVFITQPGSTGATFYVYKHQ